MRVLIVTPQLKIGGAERHVVELASELRAGTNEVMVVSRGGELVALLEEGRIEHRCLPIDSHGLRLPTNIVRLRNLLGDFEPDIVHAHSALTALMCRAASRGRHVPIVVTGHGWRDSRLRVVAAMLRSADAIIAVSAAMRTALIANGVASHRIIAIPHGVAARPFSDAAARQFRREVGCPDGAVLIAVVARLIRTKGHQTLIQAARTLPADNNWQIVLVGDGPLRDQLERQIADAQLASRIRVVGNRYDMGPVYGAIDVAVLPSHTEGMPLSLLEAMAHGVPVVATPVGGVPEIVMEGETGWLVPVADAASLSWRLRQLIESADLRKVVGDAARAVVRRKYSRSVMIEKTTRVYRNLIDASSLSVPSRISAANN